MASRCRASASGAAHPWPRATTSASAVTSSPSKSAPADDRLLTQPFGQCVQSRAAEVRKRRRAAGHRHQESLPGAGDLGSVAVCPIHVGRAQQQSPYPASGAEPGVTGYQAEDPLEPIGRDAARPTERAADVLVMDRAVDERDHAAETRCQSTWLEVIAQKFQQLLRTHGRELVDAHLVHLVGPDRKS